MTIVLDATSLSETFMCGVNKRTYQRCQREIDFDSTSFVWSTDTLQIIKTIFFTSESGKYEHC